MEAGIDDVGIGVLFGLFDWRFEVLALMQHIRHLERTFGVGPHTISVPRLEPAVGSDIAEHPPHPVADVDFRKIVAILRLAVPYTGIIMSTRETAGIRRETFALGVSQISAGSRTNPGGYTDDTVAEMEQFQLGDHRSLDEVIRDVARLGYIPSFCTACYRLGRTGADFMDLAKPGEIKEHCDPNALSTFLEYLEDYGSPATRAAGERLIDADARAHGVRAQRRRLREAHGPRARRRARRVLLGAAERLQRGARDGGTASSMTCSARSPCPRSASSASTPLRALENFPLTGRPVHARAGRGLRHRQAGLRADQPRSRRLARRPGQGRRHRARLPRDGRGRAARRTSSSTACRAAPAPAPT